jgi:hypothetical protein
MSDFNDTLTEISIESFSTKKNKYPFDLQSEAFNNMMLSIFQNNKKENPFIDNLDKDCCFVEKRTTKDKEIHSIDSEEKIESGNKNKFVIKKGIGRGRKRTKKLKYYRTHNFDSIDNNLRKIHVNFISFIVYYINDILKQLNYKERFYNLSYSFKNRINKMILEDLKNQTIKHIISNTISEKYKNINKLINYEIVSKIESENLLNKILSEKYIDLFKKVYFKNNRCIDLRKYGHNKIIILSKYIKMYEELLIKNEKKDKNIRKKFEECIKHYFLNNYIL